MKPRILVLDDDAAMTDLLQEGLEARGFVVEAFIEGAPAIEAVSQRRFDAVVADLNMRGLNGLEVTARVTEVEPGLPVILITAFGSMETAIAAIRTGAYDFVPKPFQLEQLVVSLERACRHRALTEEVSRLRQVVAIPERFRQLVGESSAMTKLRSTLAHIAQTDATVLVRGESGTGKEVAVRTLHEASRRRGHPFVAVNLSAMSPHLLESELFGHVKGAFTGATQRHDGVFVQAHRGTLMLDEIGELALELQPKLLRALEERRVRPVGATEEIEVDVRIVAATNRDLESLIEEGRFRQDLYFRLAVLEVELPPLRARGRDALSLAQLFVERLTQGKTECVEGITPSAAERLLAYPWPGNVRELRNAMEHAVALARNREVTIADLPRRIREYRREHVLVTSNDPSELAPLADVERRYILRVLEDVGGNKTTAAKVLGLGRKTLYRKLEKYGVDDGGER